MAKSNSVIETVVDGCELTVRVADFEPIHVDIRTLADDVRAAATLHGLKQKICDAAAISRDPETGRPASARDKYDAMAAVAGRLLAGEWNAKRGDGTGAGAGAGAGGLLARALVRFTGKSAAEIREFLAAKTRAEHAALRANPKIAAIIDELRAERGGDGVDTDEMLSELLD